MSANGTIFDPHAFLQKLSIFVRARPDMAPHAYAKAAIKMRTEAEHYPDKRLALQVLASRLDTLSAEATLPPVNDEPQDIVSVFADDLPDGIVTEYDALVANIGHAKVDDEGNARSALGAAIMEQHYADEQDRRIAEPVQITPASAKPSTTLFGSQALVQYGGISGTGSFTSTTIGSGGNIAAQTEAQVVRWEGRANEAMVCSVSVYRVADGAGATFPAGTNGTDTYIYRPYARILWGGMLGVPNEAYIDIGRGQQFSIPCCYLYVNVGMGATQANSGGTTYAPGSMVLGAHMGFFGNNRQSQLYYTQYADNVEASGGTAIITIPRFANTIEGITVLTPASWTMTVRNAASSALSNAVTVSNIQQRGQAYTLPDDAYQALMTNNVGSIETARVVFGISI